MGTALSLQGLSVTDDQVERIAEVAAKKALGEMFEIFGLNISTQEGRREFAQDMNFLRTARVGSGRFTMAAVIGIGGSVATGIGYLLWSGFKAVMLVLK